MDIAKIATSRRSCKAFDADRKIPPDQIEQICTLLRYAPSSVNSQPWHFVIAGTDEGKALIATATQGAYANNEPKVRNASHVVVLCARTDIDESHLAAILAQEDQDGRFATPEAKVSQNKLRTFYVNLHRIELQDTLAWMEKQVYLVLGTLLQGVATLELDACPMEGFDHAMLDEALGLRARGLTAVVMVGIGYRSDADFNGKLPKSRLPGNCIFTMI